VRWARPAALVVVVVLLLVVAPLGVGAAAAPAPAECGGKAAEVREEDARGALRLKLVAVASILAAGAAGALVPVLGRSAPALRPDGDVFFAVKAFAAGVILATGMVHILPAAFDALAPPCSGGGGARGSKGAAFPFAGLVAMCSAMATMMVDSVAAGYYQRSHFRKARPVDDAADGHHQGGRGAAAGDEEGGAEHAGHLHVHTHATHGHAHGHAHDHAHGPGHGGPAAAGASPDDASSVAVSIRHRVISQVRPPSLHSSSDKSLPFSCSKGKHLRDMEIQKSGMLMIKTFQF